MPVFLTIVLDGVGIGAQPDAADFGDSDAHTLGHVCEIARPCLPNLSRWGLGCVTGLTDVPAIQSPAADFGRMQAVSAGKDSTTGHWELAGIQLHSPFPTYPDGFPEDVVRRFVSEARCGGVLGNEAASGTEIIERLGARHAETGWPIVYTSADSVFQVAAHVDVVPLPRLYEICRLARERICVGPHAVGRVIARPFHGREGDYVRLSADRKDFALEPPGETIQSLLMQSDVETVSVGKVADLFARSGFATCVKTRSNAEGIEETQRAIQVAAGSDRPVFIWTNLVDFDQEYGHRNDVGGFAAALEQFDGSLPLLESAMPTDSVFAITADHGNDPAFPGTDHTREYVPMLVRYEGSGRSLGVRSTFCDHAASVAAYFGVEWAMSGTSFLPANVRARGRPRSI